MNIEIVNGKHKKTGHRVWKWSVFEDGTRLAVGWQVGKSDSYDAAMRFMREERTRRNEELCKSSERPGPSTTSA